MTEPQHGWRPPAQRSPLHHQGTRRPRLDPLDTDQHTHAAETEQTRRRQDLEWRIFERAREMNVRHADAAWERRYKRPLSPYGLAFIFRQQSGQVAAATKLWLAGPEPDDPVDLLGALVDLARGRAKGQLWDVRREIADRAVGVGDDAVYLGLVMSSLDTRTGTWAQVCRTASSALQIPGTFLYVCGAPDGPDGQRAFVADRRAAGGHGKVTIWSHQAFSTPEILSPHPYLKVSLSTLYQESRVGHVLSWMTALDHEVRVAETDRRARS
ncbi:hypothetical protein FB565_000328 [Actinoplanes lutulentus]|uniref:Uncharacterized protein n=1 Tax=Actinoplanes lutulentus TaxID=1287878 RepID=A0A327ZKY4_9ACTN|nr:hypothetical protein [Actinoplanes lutulentus]MBB2940624.1 hypothetical protein [Actinoplanes lutulentus]RAK42935.1 hypothetical protein B0I29_10165 [Actinoplanes lutulentus]